MKNTALEKIHNNILLPNRVNDRIKEVLFEDAAYVADELVELSEEILLQLASIGITLYLNQSNQKAVYSDFLIQLFTTNAHAYNAGPLFRWAAHMIKDIEGDEIDVIKSLFWKSTNQNDFVLNPDFDRLSTLRNAVMHGFFILPPQRNQEEATHLASILELLVKEEVFKIKANYSCHFLKNNDGLYTFSGDWKINSNQWIEYSECYDFGKLSAKILYENSDQYEIDQKLLIEKSQKSVPLNPLISKFLNENDKGALGYWLRPSQSTENYYSSLCKNLFSNGDVLTVCQSLDDLGVNFTADFLLNRVVKHLVLNTGDSKYSKDPRKALVQLRKKCRLKPVIIIDKIHICLFNTSHLLSLFDLFYENNIQVIVFGVQHPWLGQFFNQSINDFSEAYQPEEDEWQLVLSNYVRFKGPDFNVPDQKLDYKLLLKITKMAVNDLNSGPILARRFADRYKFPMEFVNEVFDILSPFYINDTQEFEMDTLDEFYNFPKETTEASRILFSIGRRDTKLEYRHKVLKR